MGKTFTDLFSKNRVEAFSDGVFAIIITLLVLELKVPHIVDRASQGELYRALAALVPKFVSWIISFLTVCIIWTNHHRLFSMFREIDIRLFWWNANLLLWVSFIPFPTALMGDYPSNPLAVAFYGVMMSLMAVSFSLMRLYIARNDHILHIDVNRKEFRRGTALSLVIGPLFYLAGAGASYVNSYLSFAIYAGIAVYFVFPHATRAKS